MQRTRKIVLTALCIAIVSGATYYAWTQGWMSAGGPGQKMTFLGSPVHAFTVPPLYNSTDYWQSYSFGNSVPSNTVIALCIFRLLNVGVPNPDFGGVAVGGADFCVCTAHVDPSQPVDSYPGYACYSVGADKMWWYGSWFAYIPVNDGIVWCSNAGYVCPVDVWVVGYVTEETKTSVGYYMDFTTSDVLVNSSASSSWTTVDLSSIMASHPGYALKGVYIAINCSITRREPAQNISFRQIGSSTSGVDWTMCYNDPGSHTVGWIGAERNGFEWKTDGASPISMWVEGFVFECPRTEGDSFEIRGPTLFSHTGNVWGASSPIWGTSPAFSGVKALIATHMQTQGIMGKFQVRPSGAANVQIWHGKTTCGTISILVGLGGDGAFQYCSTQSLGSERDFSVMWAASMVVLPCSPVST